MLEDPARLAEQFIRRMDARGVRLDYSPHTLVFLPLPESDGPGTLTRELAGYYGEVIRRHLGGSWEEAERFPRLRIEGELVVQPLETAQQVWTEDPDVLAREFGELALSLERAYPEVFDDVVQREASPADYAYAGTGLLLRWLAQRGRLPTPLLEALQETPGTAGQVFRIVLGGRLTSSEVTLEADRFLRCYLRSPALGATWLDDLARLSAPHRYDDERTFARVSALLDQRWSQWHNAGRPTG